MYVYPSIPKTRLSDLTSWRSQLTGSNLFRKGHLPHLQLPLRPKSTALPLLPILHCSPGEATGEHFTPDREEQFNGDRDQLVSKKDKPFWKKWMADTAEMRARVAKLGLAAVLAYGLFDAVTYTTFFVLAFLGYEKSTGKNPAANLQALLGIVVLMWTGNNITRPFRVAGAAASAPVIDKVLKRVQKYFNLPSVIWAFVLVVSIIAVLCLSIVGSLVLSKWGR